MISLSSEARSPHAEFDYFVAGGACATWPAPAVAPTTGTPPPNVKLLFVASTFDVRTPIEWARQLVARSSAPLVTFNGATHAVFGRDPCVNNAVDAFLADPTAPIANVTC